MAEIPLDALARHVGGSYLGQKGLVADRAVIDSREAGAGSLFFALAGERTDGHRYVDDVLDVGGSVVVSRDPGRGPRILVEDVERALLEAGGWARNRISVPVIGLSGSSGKTTTRRLLELALSTRFRVAATEGNRNNQLGLPLTLLNVSGRPEVVVLELGMNHAGELRQLCRVAHPTDSVITNIGLAHLEYLGSREGVARAKAELLEGTAPGGFCVIPRGEEILDRAAAAAGLETVRVGPGGDRWLEECPEGARIQPGGYPVRMVIPGRHNLDNALVAVTAAELMGVPPEASLEAIGGYRGMAGRSALLQAGPFRVMDESYNSNPDSAEACLRALAEMPGGGGVAILGDMLELGERTEELHRRVLAFADGLGLRRIVLVGRLYSGLAGEATRTDTVAGRDWRHAVELAVEALEPGGAVLVKASRSLRLERAVDLLRERLSGSAEGEGP